MSLGRELVEAVFERDALRAQVIEQAQRITDLEAGTALAKLRAELATAIRDGEFWARVTRETEDRFASYRKEFRSRATEKHVAELERDRARIDTLEAWAERSNLTGDGSVRLRISWPETSTLRETADAIQSTLDAAKGE